MLRVPPVDREDGGSSPPSPFRSLEVKYPPQGKGKKHEIDLLFEKDTTCFLDLRTAPHPPPHPGAVETRLQNL